MSFPVYKELRESGVAELGTVPSFWTAVRLKHIADIRLSNIDKHSVDGQTSVTLCNYVDVYRNHRITTSIDFMKATATDDQIERLTLKVGDCIITKDSEDPSDIGVPAYVAEVEPNLVCRYHLALLRPAAELSDGLFLAYLMRSNYAKSTFEVASRGLTRYALGKGPIDNFRIALPSLMEQKQIAAFLDRETAKIDALIEEQQRLIELLKEKRQAVISHAVTKGLDPSAPMKDRGVEWLGQVPAHWEIAKLKLVADFSGGGTPNRDTPEFWNGSIPWVSPKDMKLNFISDSQEYITHKGLASSTSNLIDAGAVLMVVRSGILQHTIPVAINTVPVSLNQDMKAIRFADKSKARFFLYWVQGLNEVLLRFWSKQGATVESIEHSYLGNTDIAFPESEELEKILKFIALESETTIQLKAQSEAAIALLQERRAALISAAVTGKIDVRGLVDTDGCNLQNEGAAA